MSNVEGRYPVVYKGLSRAKPTCEILRFDIRYSAVRCSVQMKFHMRLRVSANRRQDSADT